MFAIGFITPLSQHPLYPLWSRLRTSPQNVGNRLYLSIVTTSSLPSLDQAVDFSTECWQQVSSLYCHKILSTLFGAGCGLLHRMLAIGFILSFSCNDKEETCLELWLFRLLI
ncbi:hypothetical protein DY000_02013928 [Brassica cretica]|uniref:Uncharacterized protein n=1 Tax=Brassica cretica TaxID=69181 RepID=A0ABQ7D691_BRACR|nr:hypothetical protein DY000_02013928 [Brassica cretica]